MSAILSNEALKSILAEGHRFGPRFGKSEITWRDLDRQVKVVRVRFDIDAYRLSIWEGRRKYEEKPKVFRKARCRVCIKRPDPTGMKIVFYRVIGKHPRVTAYSNPLVFKTEKDAIQFVGELEILTDTGMYLSNGMPNANYKSRH